jgi:hypothetical protein
LHYALNPYNAKVEPAVKLVAFPLNLKLVMAAVDGQRFTTALTALAVLFPLLKMVLCLSVVA